MIKTLLLFVLCFGPAPTVFAQTKQVVFDGYYKLTLKNTPIGYTIVRYEHDPKAKQFHVAYFLKTNKAGGDIQESFKGVSNEKFEPISYSYTSQVGGKVKTLDAQFKGDTMKIIKTDGAVKRDETHKIPKGTFLSSYLGFLMLQKGISVGRKFSYSAVAEEDGDSYNGEAFIKEKIEHLGQPAFRILNKFKGSNFVSYMNEKGEVLSTHTEQTELSTELVKDPSEATKGLTVPTSTLNLVFGSVPNGKTNALHAPKGP